MKPYLFFILLPFLFPVKEKDALSYEDAMAYCDSIRRHNMKELIFPLSKSDCVVGAEIPSFTVKTNNGLEIRSEDLKGKPTIINFWFMFCTPCVAEQPGLNAIVEKYGDDVNFMAINGSDDPELVPEFLENNPFHFTHIIDGGDFATQVFKMKWGYPTTFILNQEGVIVKAFSGGKTDERAIDEIQEKIVPVIEVLLDE